MMTKAAIIALVFAVLAVTAAHAADMYPCQVTRCIDGDTVVVGALKLEYGVGLFDRTFRLSGFDAWESRRVRQTVGEITDAELTRGREAKAALEALLKDAKAVYVAPGDEEMDAYGRLLGRLYVSKDGRLIDVATYMVEQDFDRNWFPDGRARP